VRQGSKFHFTVVFEIRESESESLTKEVNNLVDLPVLVVDDNASNRRILSEILMSWHMKPTLTRSGAEALSALGKVDSKNSFALALVDVHMPDMDGFAVADFQSVADMKTRDVYNAKGGGSASSLRSC